MQHCPDDITLAEFAADALKIRAATDVRGHLEQCHDCRGILATLAELSLLAAPAASAVTEPAPRLPASGWMTGGESFSRYELVRPIGAGGMGAVWLARDPALDRNVAIKVLRGVPAVVDGDRLRREAQALAQLSHPNVVGIYEVGACHGVPFVAMEHVAGRTLGDWLSVDRGWRAVVRTFVDLGRGIEAIHGADLVHGDIKPSNVLIGEDGRVRITDFGLARSVQAYHDTIAGTPAYMAPEQRRGHRADPRSDQYAYCVSLYEALTGKRPRSVPRRPKRAPRWLWRALTRGLRASPTDRFDSMQALVGTLERGLRRRGRAGVIAAVGAAALVAAVVLTVALSSAPQARPSCVGDGILDDVWSRATRERIARAFRATGLAHADETLALTDARLDAYATAWRTAYVTTCRATHVRGDQSPVLLDHRMACLRRRRADLAALVAELSTATPAAVDNATRAVADLPVPGDCTTLEPGSIAPLPSEPIARARIDDMRARLSRVRALRRTGSYADARDAADDIAGDLRETDYPPLLAEAWFERGAVLARLAESDDAERELGRAWDQAARAGDDRIAAASATELALMSAHRRRLDEGLARGQSARNAIARAGGDPAASVRLSCGVGALLFHFGQLDAADAEYRAGLAIAEASLDDAHPATACPLTGLGELARSRGVATDEGLAYVERALASREAALGPRHPELEYPLLVIGDLLTQAYRLDEAEQAFARVLSILEPLYGTDHAKLIRPLQGMGHVHRRRGDVAAAIAWFERADALVTAHYGAEHSEHAWPLQAIGTTHMGAGDAAAALPLFERALAVHVAAYGDTHPAVCTLESKLALALFALGRTAPGVRRARHALAVCERHGLRRYDSARVEIALARIAAKRGDFAIARRHADTAIDTVSMLPRADPRLASELATMVAWRGALPAL